MRLQDELRALFAIGDPSTRRYILGQVPRLPLHSDSAELEELFESAVSDVDRPVSAQALVAWHQLGPRLTLYAHGLDRGRIGTWTAVAMRVDGVTPVDAPADEEEPDAPAQRAALATLLSPCRDAVLTRAARGGGPGEAARQILGMVPFDGSLEMLGEGAEDPSRAVGALLALSRRDPRLAGAALARLHKLRPWIVAQAAGAAGGKPGLAAAVMAARDSDEAARWGAAAATAHLGGEDWVSLARILSGDRSPWVQVILLDALGQLLAGDESSTGSRLSAQGANEAVTLLDQGLKQAPHDLVRIMAIRSLGNVRHDTSAKRALKCLERGSPLLQAAAIESLVRLDYHHARFTELLTARAAAGPIKLRGAAVLGLMTCDQDASLRHALELVRSPDPASRVEGAYCLGYLHCPTSLELLSLLARRDPFTPAALQGVKSLAHFPETHCAPVLIELLGHSQLAVSLAALRVLSHYAGEAQSGVVAAMERAESSHSPETVRVMLREMGRLGPAVGGVTDFLARPRRERWARAGALEGLVRSGQVPVEVARGAAGDKDPLVSVLGALALLVAGDSAGAALLGRRLADEATAPWAMEATRDLAVLAPEAGRGGRYLKLQTLLGKRPGTGRTAVPRRPASGVVQVRAPSPGPVQRRDLEPVRPRDSSQALQAAVGVDRAGLVAQLSQVLERPGAGGSRAQLDQWPLQLTFLIGPRGWLDRLGPYRTLLPAALVIAVAMGFFLVQFAQGLGSPDASLAVRRDRILGKVGSSIIVEGNVVEVLPDQRTVVLLKDKKVRVRVWMPGRDVHGVKVGTTVAVRGLVKDIRGDDLVVVQGFDLKES